MTIPDQDQWLRIEALAAELGAITPAAAVDRLMELKAAGEPVSLVSFVGRWLSLPPPPALFEVGDTVGRRFVLLGKLGEGGMGVVWEATDTFLQRKVAIKMIHPFLVTPALRDRFVTEMRALGQLNDPGIVQIYDVGEEPRPVGCSVPFFVMEVVEGGVRLDLWAERHREERERLLRVMVDVCTAMQHAHERSIVHRDLKPSNILVRANGKPVILDFGVARLAGGDPGEPDSGFSGTPQYAAPEQHLGRDQDFRSGESVDVYAIGAILFEVLTGTRLFEFPPSTPVMEMRRQILEGSSRRLRDLLPDCPVELDEMVATVVRRDPVDRHFSMAALARALARVSASLQPAASAPPLWRPVAGAGIPRSGWKIAQKLGEGSAGEVWLGVHTEIPEPRVFKFCDSEEKARTLKREMTLFRLLKQRVGRNPHFVQLHEVSLDEAPWYLMMEHVQARDLVHWCTMEGRHLEDVPLETRLEIVAQAAEALQSAHDAGILHRDIKPANLLVQTIAPSGHTAGGVHVWITDFGIGQIVADELRAGGTRMGFTRTISNSGYSTLSGTMLYVAPEVLEGEAASARSDIYSLGVVLWQLLIGNLSAAVDATNWRKRVADPLLTEDLERCLSGEPGERWSSAAEFARSLRALPNRRAAESARQEELARAARSAFRRGVLRASAVAAVVIATLVVLAAVAWHQRREAKQANARRALEQAGNIWRLDQVAGRRARGLSLLADAVELPGAKFEIRSSAAALLALPDLVALPVSDATGVPTAADSSATFSIRSPNHQWVASPRVLKEHEGIIELTEVSSGAVRSLARSEFPWLPVPERGFVQFSPDGRFLAVAGPETSLHILIFETKSGDLSTYIFAGDQLTSYAWHPTSRAIATGHASGSVKLWDLRASRNPSGTGGPRSDFDLPPKLDSPALDTPFAVLDGWRDRIAAIGFHPRGEWLAAFDSAGWLRMWRGHVFKETTEVPTKPLFAMEAKVGTVAGDPRVEFTGEHLLVRPGPGLAHSFVLQAGDFAREVSLGQNLRSISWSSDGAQLCVLSDADAHWLDAETLEQLGSARGMNPQGVAYDSLAKGWVIPQQGRFVLRWPGLRGEPEKSTPQVDRWELARAEQHRGSRLGIASSADGRIALYYGKYLQFAKDGKPQPNLGVAVQEGPGAFDQLLWDSGGRLVSIVYAVDSGCRVETFTTSASATVHLGTISASGSRLVSAEDGAHLIERGAAGLARLNARTGARHLLDGSPGAKQDAPLAVSRDGSWIAAVVDRDVARIFDAKTGAVYSDLRLHRETTISRLAWDPSGRRLAALTVDGAVHVWTLQPWRDWLVQHGIAN